MHLLCSANEAHSEWIVKFRIALSQAQEHNAEQIDVHTIAKDDCCEFGKWLYGEGKVKYGFLPSYRTCLDKHAAFHVEAGNIASVINAKQYTEAEAMLENTFSFMSDEVGVALKQLQKEAVDEFGDKAFFMAIGQNGSVFIKSTG